MRLHQVKYTTGHGFYRLTGLLKVGAATGLGFYWLRLLQV